MQLKDFQKKYKHSINKGLSYGCIDRLRDLVDFDFNVYLPSIQMNLQRDLVWSREQKQALILTILRDQKISPIIVIQSEAERKERTRYQWQVIDGKQRLTTIFSFLSFEFSINYNGVDYFFNDLPQDCQKQIRQYDEFVVDVHYSYSDEPISDQTKIDLFEDINWLGTPQDISHMNKLKNSEKETN